MAFNPFRAFRKHQKVIMASLVGVSMVTFVLCGGIFGKGDFAGWFQTTFMGHSRDNKVASVYGKAIEYPDIDRLRSQRRLANEYMSQATGLVAQKIVTKARDIAAKGDERLRGTVESVLRSREQLVMQAQLAQFTGTPLTQYVQQVQMQARFLEITRQSVKDRPGDLELLDDLRLLLQLDAARMVRGVGMYFGGSLSDTDILDFMIWQHQAERLGIRLSTEDIQKAIKRDTFNRLTSQDSRRIEEFLARSSSGRTAVTAELLYAALGDEFRVRMAQEAMLGSESDASALVPSLATPREFWDFYRNNLTTIQVALIPVKAEEFLAKVTDKPTNEELEDLFKKYRDREYAPESDKPGFKEPKKVQIEWVAGKAESPYFQKKAHELLTGLIATTPSAPLPAAGALVALTHRIASEYYDAVLQGDRFNLFGQKSPYRLPPLTDPNFVLPSYTAAAGPESLADMVGQAAAAGVSGNTLVTALSALSTYQAGAVVRGQKTQAPFLARDTKQRAIAGLTLFLAGTQPAPALTFGGMWNAAEKEKQFLPLGSLSPLLTRRLEDGLTHELLISSLESAEKELQRLSKEPDKKELPAYLAKLKQQGLETGRMTAVRDRYSLPDDKGIKPFRDAYVRPPAADAQAKNFHRLFYGEEKLFEPQRWPGGFDWPTASEPFIYWKVDEKAAHAVLFTDPGVRPKVEAAWKLLKARELAKKEVEQVAAKARETKGDPQVLRDLGAKLKREIIEPILPLAHLTRQKQAMFTGGAAYARDQLPKEIQDKITYPRLREMGGEILKLQDLQPGENAIIHDQPELTYYVTVLIKQTEPSREEFFQAYRGAAPDVGIAELFEMFEKERRDQYRKEFMEQLRAEARLEVLRDRLEKGSRTDEG